MTGKDDPPSVLSTLESCFCLFASPVLKIVAKSVECQRAAIGTSKSETWDSGVLYLFTVSRQLQSMCFRPLRNCL